MQKGWFAGWWRWLLCFCFALPPSVNGQKTPQWEFLQVSGIETCSSFGVQKPCRRYEYVTSGQFFEGHSSLEWMKESGWELVGVSTYENFQGLYFKRSYNRTRTQREIERLKKDYELAFPKPPINGLIDLDTLEGKDALVAFNRREELRIRTPLGQISGLQLKIISITSDARSVREPRVGAEIVLDATPVLLKDGNRYRSSDADKYFQEAVKQIYEKIQANTPFNVQSNARQIASGAFKPSEIGKFGAGYGGVTLKISVVVNYKSEQIIVAQNLTYGRWLNNQ